MAPKKKGGKGGGKGKKGKGKKGKGITDDCTPEEKCFII